ncbi:hypothetical protein HPB51_001417 [Rhipicephalus microplus]|uniref:Uncharacterized protein n=1 Tax=Rhipicephalus microplus TaxID=6941 RepID=A0A9J6EEI2_RHIMP|nr:hypothetical protein HPB51_001417 [Rhipicephalus microplus]
MIVRHAVVEGSGDFDHLGFFNVHPNLSTRAHTTLPPPSEMQPPQPVFDPVTCGSRDSASGPAPLASRRALLKALAPSRERRKSGAPVPKVGGGFIHSVAITGAGQEAYTLDPHRAVASAQVRIPTLGAQGARMRLTVASWAAGPVRRPQPESISSAQIDSYRLLSDKTLPEADGRACPPKRSVFRNIDSALGAVKTSQTANEDARAGNIRDMNDILEN